MANADGYVLPKPGIPRTLGILNIIFGVLLGLCGMGGIASLLLAGPGVKFVEKIGKDAEVTIEARNKEAEKAYDDRIASAKTEDEKKAIEQEKANSIANRPQFKPADMSAVNEVLHDPTIMTVSIIGAVSGLILQVVLMISGIGLVRLTAWGRSLAVFWGGLQILQVLALLMANILIVQPVNKPISDRQIARLEAEAKINPNSPEVAVLPFTKAMANMAIPLAIINSVSGMIYPVILLILLNTAGAKVACRPAKPEGEGEF